MQVDLSCPRFVHVPLSDSGLGNKYFSYVVGVMLAIDMDVSIEDPSRASRDPGVRARNGVRSKAGVVRVGCLPLVRCPS